MRQTDIPRLRTTAIIADSLDVPLHRIVYILRTRPYIRPAALAGRTRLFDKGAVAEIRRALEDVTQAVRHD